MTGSSAKDTARTALRDSHAALRAQIEQLAPEDWSRSVYSGWAVQDLVSHLASIEGRFRDQVQSAVAGKPWSAAPIDTYNADEVLHCPARIDAT